MDPSSYAKASENRLTAHMQRVYQVFYFPKDYRKYLVTRRQPYMDVRHIVRTRLSDIYKAGPSQVARAEGLLRQGFGDQGGPTHGAIIYSRKVFVDTLQDYQPWLIKRMNRLIEQTGN